MNPSTEAIAIAPSIAAGNLLHLEREVRALEAAGADAIHVDVMDGHFVPLLTLGVPFVQAIRTITELPLDVHIMVTNPEAVAQDYLDAGADCLTFHIEVAQHPHRLCQFIRQHGRRAGIALNPATHWHTIEYLLPVVDQITVMAVNPGYSGQKHIAEIQPKIAKIHEACRRHAPRCGIMVDGGVTAENIRTLVELGATSFVAGNAILGKPDYSQAILSLRSAAGPLPGKDFQR